MQINYKTISEIIDIASQLPSAIEQKRFIENRISSLASSSYDTARQVLRSTQELMSRMSGPSGPKRPSQVDQYYPKQKPRTHLPEKTQTKLKFKHKEEMVTEDHSHNDLYKYKHHINFSHKKSHRRLGYWEYFTQKNNFVVAEEGKQGNQEIWCVGNALQVFANGAPGATISAADEQNIYKWSVSPYALNPYQSIPAGNVFGANSKPLIDKIHLETIENSTIIANTQVVPIQVEMCWLTPRKSQTDGPLQSWRNVLTDKALGETAADNPDFNNVAPTYASLAKATDDMYGLSPHGHKEWRRQWKTLHRKSFYLNAGDQRKVMTRIHYNKTWDREALKQAMNPDNPDNAGSAYNYWVNGISIVCMLTIRPGTVVLKGTGDRATSVTTGLGQVAYINATKYTFSSMGSTDRISNFLVQPGFFRESAAVKSGKVQDVKDAMQTDDKLLQDKT